MKKLTIEDLKEICLDRLGEGWIAADGIGIVYYFAEDAPQVGKLYRWTTKKSSPLLLCSMWLMEAWYCRWTESIVEVKKVEKEREEPKIGELCWFWNERLKTPKSLHILREIDKKHRDFLSLQWESVGFPPSIYITREGLAFQCCKSAKDDFIDGIYKEYMEGKN